jgi:glycosyltransferase involved in cell wall biosynthesis
MQNEVLPRVAMICNIPSPYREPTHVILQARLGAGYHVFYCAHTESNRQWNIKYGNYDKTFLKKSAIKVKNKAVYVNLDIIKALRNFNPDVVITAGFFPTMLLAFFWCKLHKKKHIVYTDGTLKSEEHLTSIHRSVRKMVYRSTHAFIGVSKKSLDLYKSYKVKAQKLFLSPYCADNAGLGQFRNMEKKYDVIFCGQFIERKMPFFFIEVIKLVNATMPCRVLLVGDGNLKADVMRSLEDNKIDYHYPGFVQAEDLPPLFASARVFAFPTQYDAWGLVANEACALGIPVIACDNAGAANELIVDGHNGYVLPLEEKVWADHIIKLLSDADLYQQLSDNAYESVQPYNYNYAVEGVLKAVSFAVGKQGVKP